MKKINRMFKRKSYCLALFGTLLFTLLYLAPAWARVGGGQTYSGGASRGGGGGGGGGYSGGGSGAGFDIIYLVFRLVFAYPIIGIPLAVLIIYFVFFFDKGEHGNSYAATTADTDPLSSSSAAQRYPELLQYLSVSPSIRKLQEQDPNFSRILFMDFCYSLFASIHTARGSRKLKEYTQYFSDPVIKGLEALPAASGTGLQSVEGIIVGSAHLTHIQWTEGKTRIGIEFEANYTEKLAGGATQSWFVVERWNLCRDIKVLSKPPESTRALRCPSCGAPLAQTQNGSCPSCGKRNDQGQFDWFVEFRSQERTQKEPLLTSDVPEEGTDLPTLYDPSLGEDQQAFATRHPDFVWSQFETRTRYIFMELQKAWTERRWERARAFESGSLFQTHFYWISTYQRQGLVNVLSNIQIEQVIPVRILQDRFYSSITVRIFAQMIDFTQKTSGELVSGSKTSPRRFSEYWTLMRSHNAQKPKGGNDQCPSCGAPLKVSQLGACEYCKTLVTTGDFDWVLSEIEQDESYSG